MTKDEFAEKSRDVGRLRDSGISWGEKKVDLLLAFSK